MRRTRPPAAHLLLTIGMLIHAWAAEDATMSLAGSWGFQLDRDRTGITGQWFTRDLADTIPLPGTTDQAQKGDPNQAQEYGRLTRRFLCKGWAWYQRMVDIPPAWKGRRLVLTLERTRWAQVWFDGADAGAQESLVAPHVHELAVQAVPGRHRLTILVDNANLPPVGGSHQIAEHTQTNWNGIVGRLELTATDAVWLADVQIHPRWDEHALRVVASLGGPSTDVQGSLQVAVGSRTVDAPITPGARRVEAVLDLGADAACWDEWQPALQRCTVSIQGTAAAAPFRDQRSLTTGLRAFTTRDNHFVINGRTTFLRGKHDACVFPLTGYAPMDRESWLAVMTVARAYGINHYRFHSWCPPEAAFAAADELGIYLQPELPCWGKYGDAKHQEFMLREGRRLLDAYGSHPSFVMLSLGNELHGSRAMMAEMVSALRTHDPRHLYAQGSNNFFGSPSQAAGDDYWTTMRTRPGDAMVRGSFAHADLPLGRVQAGPADTIGDLGNALTSVTIPVIGHEVGQYQVFPDLKEIPRYTGVLEARNFIRIRERLRSQGLLDQADDFVRASGRLAAICYRAENELAIRTRGLAGFHLLDLQDFPGQGTALVGMLNAFMESKGLITPEEWRQSCDAQVVLARLPAYTWTTDQTFSCSIEIANYGRDALPGAAVAWRLGDAQGNPLHFGNLDHQAIPQGTVATAGALAIPLADIPAPAQLTLDLEVAVEGKRIMNRYPLWVYPAVNAAPAPAVAPAPGVLVAERLDPATVTALGQGARVLLLPNADALSGQSVPGFFATDFWCWPMFHNPPGTMGLLMDPRHPALASFPTAFHGDWQWFDVVMASTPMILDALPAGSRPIVQVIDNFDRCHRLGLVAEFTHGGGRLLILACDGRKLATSPAGRQLIASLRAYLASDACHPDRPLPDALAQGLMHMSVDLTRAGVVVSASSSQDGNAPGLAGDGDDSTRWCAADDKPGAWWQVDLGQARPVARCAITWERDGGYRYVVEASSDGTAWTVLNDQRGAERAGQSHIITWEPQPVRHLRITVTGLKKGCWASIREVRLAERHR